MPTGKKIKVQAEKNHDGIKISANDLGNFMDSIEDIREAAPDVVREDPVTDDVDDEVAAMPGMSDGFTVLQEELQSIRQSRIKLTRDMENDDLDKDERDTLKARGSLLDSRERSAREELKLFHKNELGDLGQIKKIRIVIEDYLKPSVSIRQGHL